jgi:lipopolysaccharide export system protein LptA
MKNFLLIGAGLLMFTVGLLAFSSQSSQPQSDAKQPVAAQQQNDMQNQEAKPFSGTIVKEKGKFVLKDTTTKMSYQLDDQDKAKQFEGKQVKVTGKLDLDSNLIHVENIEAVS